MFVTTKESMKLDVEDISIEVLQSSYRDTKEGVKAQICNLVERYS